jgi:hypothetical protein
VKRFALAIAGPTGVGVVAFVVLRLLGAIPAFAIGVAVGVAVGVAILVWLWARLRASSTKAHGGETGRQVLGITVVATLAVGTFIAVYAAQLIPGNSHLGLFFAQLTLILALIAIAGAAATALAVVRWPNGRARRWGVRIAIAMAAYLALVGAVFGQVYLLALAVGYGVGAYSSTRPDVTEAASR